ncbi:23S rRNA (adenine(2503)-C(2))-methyltransferase [Shuttleworthella sp. MSX8B]|nr:23S rRNA (adenine(2503)-C(2))-methyltransferase [Shuttleworthia sp. MSX8B]
MRGEPGESETCREERIGSTRVRKNKGESTTGRKESRAMPRIDIKSMNLEELTAYVEAMGEKKFRARQLYEWIHRRQAADWDEMSNLSRDLRGRLMRETDLTVLQEADCQISRLDGTRKYLFALSDGNMVESVLMPYHHGNSVCISSQVGCRMGCRFCASTIDGWLRNLTPAEMLDQIYRIQRDSKERVSNLVLMGTGEPLDNFDNVVKLIGLVSDENGLNISQRNITVSTCGIVPRIRELADLNLSITLAISLHASSQETRRKLMPIAERYDLKEILDACRYYFSRTGRRLTFEYALVAGVNDSREDAARLAGLLGDLNCHVNLIPVNPIKERNFHQSDRRALLAFRTQLEKYGVNVTIRREMGRDIDGACGQLRRRKMHEGDQSPNIRFFS